MWTVLFLISQPYLSLFFFFRDSRAQSLSYCMEQVLAIYHGLLGLGTVYLSDAKAKRLPPFRKTGDTPETGLVRQSFRV
jgi:hypothetical protein